MVGIIVARNSFVAMLTESMKQSALFNFQSLLLVLLLVICTSTYAHATFPKIMDRNREG